MNNSNLSDIIKNIKSNKIRIKEDNKTTKKRSKQKLSNKLLRDEPNLATIYEEDNFLLKKLKEVIKESDKTFSDIIGKNGITYSTFYSLYKKHSITFTIFKKIVKLLDYEIEDIVLKKKNK